METRLFRGLESEKSATKLSSGKATEVSNCRLENPIGCINNEIGYDKWNKVSYGYPITAIWQTPDWFIEGRGLDRNFFFIIRNGEVVCGKPGVWQDTLWNAANTRPSKLVFTGNTDDDFIYGYSGLYLIKFKFDGTTVSSYSKWKPTVPDDNDVTIDDIAYPGDGWLYFGYSKFLYGSTYRRRIARCLLDGSSLTTYMNLGGSGSEQLGSAFHLAFDLVNEKIFVADYNNNRINKFNINVFDGESAGWVSITSIASPGTVYVDNTRNYLYFTRSVPTGADGQICRIPLTAENIVNLESIGKHSATIEKIPYFKRPTIIAFDEINDRLIITTGWDASNTAYRLAVINFDTFPNTNTQPLLLDADAYTVPPDWTVGSLVYTNCLRSGNLDGGFIYVWQKTNADAYYLCRYMDWSTL